MLAADLLLAIMGRTLATLRLLWPPFNNNNLALFVALSHAAASRVALMTLSVSVSVTVSVSFFTYGPGAKVVCVCCPLRRFRLSES